MQNKKLQTIIFIFLSIFLIFLVYFGLFKYLYIYPAGGDSAYHVTLVDHILENNNPKPEYTQGMHILLSMLALIINTDAISIVLYFAPFLLILCFLSVFVLVRYIFGFKTAVLAVIISALISLHPYWIWSDGTFADMISAEFLMFVFFYSFLRLINSGKLKYCFLSAIIFISLHIFHLLSFLYALSILGLFTIIFIIYHIVKKRKSRFLKNIVIFYLLIIIFAIIPAWFWYLGDYFVPILFSTLKSTLAVEEISSNGQIQGINIQHVPSFKEIQIMIGYSPLLLALLSLFFIPKFVVKKPIIFLFCLSWFVVFLLGSTTRLSPDPIRVIREFALLINIFAAFFIISLIKYFKQNKLLQATSIIIVSIFLFINFPRGMDRYLVYKSQLLYEDNKTVEWIKYNIPARSIILLGPSMGEETRKGPFDLLLKDKKFISIDVNNPIVENPASITSKMYLQKNNIDYIYYRNAPIGWFPHEYNNNFGDAFNLLEYTEKIYDIEGGGIKTNVYKVKKELLF